MKKIRKRGKEFLSGIMEGNLSHICREADMVDMSFCNNAYALHVCGPCVIRKGSKILITSHDIYKHKDGKKWKEWLEWDTSGESLYDSQVKKYKKKLCKQTIRKVKLTRENDLIIQMDKNYVIEIFNNRSCKEEIWRFSESNKDTAHLVIEGNYLRFDRG